MASSETADAKCDCRFATAFKCRIESSGGPVSRLHIKFINRRTHSSVPQTQRNTIACFRIAGGALCGPQRNHRTNIATRPAIETKLITNMTSISNKIQEMLAFICSSKNSLGPPIAVVSPRNTRTAIPNNPKPTNQSRNLSTWRSMERESISSQ